MATTIRPELSNKNEYYLTKHRYYELKHFCLQYKDWERELRAINFMNARPQLKETVVQSQAERGIGDPTAKIAEDRLYFMDRINMIRTVARIADPDYQHYILKAVTEGLSYDTLKTSHGMNISKDLYYDLYRRFFWLLDKRRK